MDVSACLEAARELGLRTVKVFGSRGVSIRKKSATTFVVPSEVSAESAWLSRVLG